MPGSTVRRVSGRARLVATTALATVAVVVAAVAGLQAGSTHGRARAWWIVLDCVAVLVAFLVPTLEQIRRDRQRLAAEAVAVDMRTAMNDALDPIVRQLGRLATAGWRDRDGLRDQTIPMVLISAAQLIGHDRVRACWFELDAGRTRRLRPVLHEGRAGAPRTTFEEGTVGGDAALDLIAHNADRFCEDIRTDPPPGWDPDHPHDYRTFIAVPVVAGATAYGLLSVDSLVPGDLREGDVPLLRLLAGLLADALAYG